MKKEERFSRSVGKPLLFCTIRFVRSTHNDTKSVYTICMSVKRFQQAHAGSRFASLELNILVNSVAVTEHREKAAEELAAFWVDRGFLVSADLLLRSPRVLIGSIDQLVDQLQDMRERYHVSYIVIPQEKMEAFAPVVAYLTSH